MSQTGGCHLANGFYLQKETVAGIMQDLIEYTHTNPFFKESKVNIFFQWVILQGAPITKVGMGLHARISLDRRVSFSMCVEFDAILIALPPFY
jgi:hypothetical protein